MPTHPFAWHPRYQEWRTARAAGHAHAIATGSMANTVSASFSVWLGQQPATEFDSYEADEWVFIEPQGAQPEEPTNPQEGADMPASFNIDYGNPAPTIWRPRQVPIPEGMMPDLYNRRFIPLRSAPSSFRSLTQRPCGCWQCVKFWLQARGVQPDDILQYETTYASKLSLWHNQHPDHANLEPRISDEDWYTVTVWHQRRASGLIFEIPDIFIEGGGSPYAAPMTPEQRLARAVERNSQRWHDRPREVMLSPSQRDLLPDPVRWILRKGGRVWSAEVECNGLRVDDVRSFLHMEAGNYSTRPEHPSVIVSGDSTVDAEIKVSCMRDGSAAHQAMALDAYARLSGAGAFAATNAGHHVHVDGTRVADLGYDESQRVMIAAAKVGFITQEALVRLATSGYQAHRHGQTEWRIDERVMEQRSNYHGERLAMAAREQTGSCATAEYRLPNATLEPIRAHAHIAIALGLLDFAERAVLDSDSEAQAMLLTIEDRCNHAAVFEEHLAASFLADALHLSSDSHRALAIAAATSPASTKHKRLWRDKTSLTAKALA